MSSGVLDRFFEDGETGLVANGDPDFEIDVKGKPRGDFFSFTVSNTRRMLAFAP